MLSDRILGSSGLEIHRTEYFRVESLNLIITFNSIFFRSNHPNSSSCFMKVASSTPPPKTRISFRISVQTTLLRFYNSFSY